MINKILPRSKRSQVTIFIIIGIIIVALAVLFFLFRGKIFPGTGEKPEQNPEAFLDLCLKDSVYEAIDLILENGGYTDPEFYYAYQPTGEEVQYYSYLCYTSQNDSSTCIQQLPAPIPHIENEIREYVAPDVDICIQDLNQDLQDKGYIVDVGYKPGNFDVSLEEKGIVITIDAEITLTKAGETSREEGFKLTMPTKLWGIIHDPVNRILTNEATLGVCQFPISEINQIYHDFDTEVKPRPNGEELYTITSTESGEIFRFAVRSCVSGNGQGGY